MHVLTLHILCSEHQVSDYNTPLSDTVHVAIMIHHNESAEHSLNSVYTNVDHVLTLHILYFASGACLTIILHSLYMWRS